jgi:hypothetical protein
MTPNEMAELFLWDLAHRAEAEQERLYQVERQLLKASSRIEEARFSRFLAKWRES